MISKIYSREALVGKGALMIATALFLSLFSFNANAQYDARVDYSISNGNPNGVWTYGKGSSGSDFTKYSNPFVSSTVLHNWSENFWYGFHKNTGTSDIGNTADWVWGAGKLITHSGNGTANHTKLAFTAPECGTYDYSCFWKHIDRQASKTNPRIVLKTASGSTVLYNITLSGYPASTSKSDRITMVKGDRLTMELGNGGDAWFNDGTEIEFTVDLVTAGGGNNQTINESICAGDSYDFYGTILTQSGTYTETITNASGCDDVITLVLSVGDFDDNDISVSSSENTVYYGYSPAACSDLSVSVNGSSTYDIVWSNSVTNASQTVCPTASTTYSVIVTDPDGCEAEASVSVSVVDVRCGKKNDKVTVCQVNKGRTHTICVSANAVPAHLAQGNTLGACGANKKESADLDEKPLRDALNVFPNPVSGVANIQFTATTNDQVLVAVYDAKGVLVNTLYQGVVSTGTLGQVSFDVSGLTPGLYLVKLETPVHTELIKLSVFH